ncbi:MAG: hypothetical protein P1U32_01685 [Legionellaceae bacterium]|nr:hypothetical protein [Legionellaceae bacterium]
MKKLALLSAVLLGVASFGLSTSVFADSQNPVDQVVTGTHETVKKAGQGTMDAVNHAGKVTNDAVKNTGKAVGAAGQGTKDTMESMTNTKQ